MSNYNFKQSFWFIDAGAGDIGAQARAQLAKAALALNDHQDVILAVSAGGYTADERPEIALTVGIDYDAAALSPAVESALAAEGLLVKAHLQSEVRYYEFGSTELCNIAEAAEVADLQTARQAIDELFALPLEPISTEHPDASAGDKDPAQIEEFSVSTLRMRRLSSARGGAVEDEIMALGSTFRLLPKVTSIADAVVRMVSGGLITIGKKMFKLYAKLPSPSAGNLVAFLAYLLGRMGGVADLVAIVQRIVPLFKSVLIKTGMNILLIANHREEDISRVNDYIKEGQLLAFAPVVHAAIVNAPGKMDAFSCGFHFYQKKEVSLNPGVTEERGVPGNPCCMGIEFTFDEDPQFSVGMNCPNGSAGQKSNSIRITPKDALVAAQLAAESEYATQILVVGSAKCTVRRAAANAPINYGICYVE